jgi:peptide methionine sulfoxide reductase msrA/msrB
LKTRTTITLIVIIITGAIILDNQRTKQTTPYNIPSSYETATFAGGCFWCMEAAFEAVEGVVESISGYTGGTTVNPTYEQVSRGNTKHLEAVQVYYDPKEVSYQSLVEVFWRSIDPTDPGGQFVDRGSQYGTAIFYHNDDQKRIAKESKENLETSNRFSKPIVTPILEFTIFYPAEEYHQDYYKKNVLNYKTYSKLSGREEFIERNWSE